MPWMDHATMPTFDSHRAGRDSDAVRARQKFWRFNRSIPLGQPPPGLANLSVETHVVVPITPSARIVTRFVTPSGRLRFPPLP
jgi:hypothetical protein